MLGANLMQCLGHSLVQSLVQGLATPGAQLCKVMQCLVQSLKQRDAKPNAHSGAKLVAKPEQSLHCNPAIPNPHAQKLLPSLHS
jgi:hypothetical protein